MAKNPKAARKTAATDTVNDRLRKSPSGTIGSTARDSTTRKATRTRAPIPISPPTVGSPQSAACLLVNPTRIGINAPVNSAAPR